MNGIIQTLKYIPMSFLTKDLHRHFTTKEFKKYLMKLGVIVKKTRKNVWKLKNNGMVVFVYIIGMTIYIYLLNKIQ